MYFRNLVLSAFFLAIVAGAVLSVYQYLFITPIIVGSEVYEVVEPITHSESTKIEVWGPEDGVERHGWNFASNFLVSFSFALILLSMMSFKTSVTVIEGVFWGVAAYLTIFAAPALGLPPEIPGMEAAYLENRQVWWLFTVIITSIALWLIAYQAIIHKVIAVILLIVPHLIGAPEPVVHGFVNTSPQAIEALTLLWHQFIIQTSIANLVLWLVIGVGASILVKKFIAPLDVDKVIS